MSKINFENYTKEEFEDFIKEEFDDNDHRPPRESNPVNNKYIDCPGDVDGLEDDDKICNEDSENCCYKCWLNSIKDIKFKEIYCPTEEEVYIKEEDRLDILLRDL